MCGWWYERHDRFPADSPIVSTATEACLVTLDVDSPSLAIVELGTHLKRNYSDLFALSPRRFEQLVCDVFRRNGHEVILTQQTRDGGVDIIVTKDRQTGGFSIVECKRYAKTRTIGVGAVRMLLGTAIDWGAQTAYLVTSTNFSGIALEKADQLRERGYMIELMAASDLCLMLQVYNTALPTLDKLTDDARREIAEHNLQDRSR